MRNRPKVLVVDDSPTTCLFIAATLEKAGYDVDVALKGQEGLAKVSVFQPSCLILDVMLPDMSGYAVCRQVQQSILEHQVYIILISAKNAPLDLSYGMRQGAHRYLPKPFSAEVLIQAVWEGVPEPLRQTVLHSFFSTSQQNERPAFLELIPRRVVDQDTMRTRNPFAHSPIIKEKHARHLYDAIDGRRTLSELATVTGLEASVVTNTLRELLKKNCIQMYDPAGKLVESTW
jgi:twitching motility two-component system response regulator PilH